MPAIINGVEQTDPVGTWPDAEAPSDGVSLPAAVAYIVEQQLGTIDNTTGVPTLGGVLGDVGNRSLASRLDEILGYRRSNRAPLSHQGALVWPVGFGDGANWGDDTSRHLWRPAVTTPGAAQPTRTWRACWARRIHRSSLGNCFRHGSMLIVVRTNQRLQCVSCGVWAPGPKRWRLGSTLRRWRLSLARHRRTRKNQSVCTVTLCAGLVWLGVSQCDTVRRHRLQ